jgi:protein gp37
MKDSKIEWTDATWNPVRGCTKVSPGCAHCYAEAFAERFRGVPGHPFENGFDLRLVPERLEDPLRWKKPCRIFVNSMSDLFHEGVPNEYIEQVCRVMLEAHWHTYQVLTKRAGRMADLLWGRLRIAALDSQIWWGVSVEDRKHGLPRIKALRESGAANSFISAEPLLEDLGKVDLSGIGWVIVGGESGPKARRCDVQWIRNMVRRCQAKGVACFVKQLGACVHDTNDAGFQGDDGDWPMDTQTEDLGFGRYQGEPVRVILKHPKGGDPSEWPEDLRVREFP